MSGRYLTRDGEDAPFQAVDVLCQDGTRRTAYVSHYEPPSVVAKVKSCDKWVTGNVVEFGDDLAFFADPTRRNYRWLSNEYVCVECNRGNQEFVCERSGPIVNYVPVIDPERGHHKLCRKCRIYLVSAGQFEELYQIDWDDTVYYRATTDGDA